MTHSAPDGSSLPLPEVGLPQHRHTLAFLRLLPGVTGPKAGLCSSRATLHSHGPHSAPTSLCRSQDSWARPQAPRTARGRQVQVPHPPLCRGSGIRPTTKGVTVQGERQRPLFPHPARPPKRRVGYVTRGWGWGTVVLVGGVILVLEWEGSLPFSLPRALLCQGDGQSAGSVALAPVRGAGSGPEAALGAHASPLGLLPVPRTWCTRWL